MECLNNRMIGLDWQDSIKTTYKSSSYMKYSDKPTTPLLKSHPQTNRKIEDLNLNECRIDYINTILLHNNQISDSNSIILKRSQSNDNHTEKELVHIDKEKTALQERITFIKNRLKNLKNKEMRTLSSTNIIERGDELHSLLRRQKISLYNQILNEKKIQLQEKYLTVFIKGNQR